MTDPTNQIYRGVKTRKILRIWYSGPCRPIFRDYPIHEVGAAMKAKGTEGRMPIDYEIVEVPDGSLPINLGNGDEPVEGVDE